MVSYPRGYRWSSCDGNAEGPVLSLDHIPSTYALGLQNANSKRPIRADSSHLGEIREATNKGWALTPKRFRAEIESMLQPPDAPAAEGL